MTLDFQNALRFAAFELRDGDEARIIAACARLGRASRSIEEKAALIEAFERIADGPWADWTDEDRRIELESARKLGKRS